MARKLRNRGGDDLAHVGGVAAAADVFEMDRGVKVGEFRAREAELYPRRMPRMQLLRACPGTAPSVRSKANDKAEISSAKVGAPDSAGDGSYTL